MPIFSVEINDVNIKYLNNIKKKNSNYDFILKGASNKNLNLILYQAFFKNYHLSPFDSLSLQEIKDSIDKNLFDKKRKKKNLHQRKTS